MNEGLSLGGPSDRFSAALKIPLILQSTSGWLAGSCLNLSLGSSTPHQMFFNKR